MHLVFITIPILILMMLYSLIGWKSFAQGQDVSMELKIVCVCVCVCGFLKSAELFCVLINVLSYLLVYYQTTTRDGSEFQSNFAFSEGIDLRVELDELVAKLPLKVCDFLILSARIHPTFPWTDYSIPENGPRFPCQQPQKLHARLPESVHQQEWLDCPFDCDYSLCAATLVPTHTIYAPWRNLSLSRLKFGAFVLSRSLVAVLGVVSTSDHIEIPHVSSWIDCLCIDSISELYFICI
jgi:hypothetical protein